MPTATVRQESFGAVTVREQAEMQALAMSEYQKSMVNALFSKAKIDPRNEDQARAMILRACQRPTFAAKALYRKPIANTHIVGPSIRLAEEMARLWRNIFVKKTVLYDDEAKRSINIQVIDLESNLSYSNDFTIQKTVERKYTKGRTVVSERLNSSGEKISICVATEDELFVKESAHASKEIRTGILRCIPDWLLEEATGAVNETKHSKAAADPEQEKRAVLDALLAVGVQPVDVELYLGHTCTHISPEELVVLEDIATTIKDGQASWHDYLGQKSDESKSRKPEPAKAPMADFKAGDPASHTPVNQPIRQLAAKTVAKPAESDQSEFSEFDDPEVVKQTTEECVAWLSKSAAGTAAYYQACQDFKVADYMQVLEPHAVSFCQRLIEECDKLKHAKK